MIQRAIGLVSQLRAAMGEARLQNNIAGIENPMVTHVTPHARKIHYGRLP